MVLTEQLNQTSNDGCESFKESEPKKGTLISESDKETSGRIFDIGAVISVSRIFISFKDHMFAGMSIKVDVSQVRRLDGTWHPAEVIHRRLNESTGEVECSR